MNEASYIRRLWLPMPVRAVPVRVVLDAGTDLDALEETILHLLRIGPRDESTLAAKLHVGLDLVLSVLHHLIDRQLVIAPDEESQLYRAAGDVQLALAAHSQPAWAFLSPHTEAFLPMIILGERAMREDGHSPRGEVVTGAMPHSRPALQRPELERRLRELIARGQLLVYCARALEKRQHDYAAAAGEVPIAARRALPAAQSPRVRSLILDVAGSHRNYASRTAWVAVDLLPRLRGAAVCVLHEPTMNPSAEDTPIAPGLSAWLLQHAQDVWMVLQERARQVALDLSLVLQRARIDSEEELDRQARERMRDLLVAHGLREVQPPPGGPPLIESIHEAERWLILAQKESAFRPQARDAWSHAIEHLMRSLAEPARPRLQKWRANRRARTASIDQAAAKARLDALRLYGRLGPSERQVIESACTQDLADRLNLESPGAGTCLALWLLPLLLLDFASAEQYGRHVLSAVESEPRLFDNLNELVAIRNATFHEGRKQRPMDASGNLIEHTERHLVAAWAALHRAWQAAPP